MRKYINKVINGDCLEVMKSMPDKCIDLVVTDPPYGINAGNVAERAGKQHGKSLAKCKDYGKLDWDNEIPKNEYFEEMFRISKNQIIFGGNYFIEHLKNSSCWIVWDKDNGNNDYADCELIWTSFTSAVRKIKFKWHGMLQDNMRFKEKRYHPTQKPVELINLILDKYYEGGIILDPFGGSGTTGIACKTKGIPFILIEKEKQYCDIANSRLELIQSKLF